MRESCKGQVDLNDHMGKVGELRVFFLHIEYVRVGVDVIQSVRISIPCRREFINRRWNPAK